MPLRLHSLLALVLAVLLPPLAAAERILTKAIDVRSLTPAEAASGIKVQLRGVVVFVESPSAIFIQDETSTTFFRLASPDGRRPVTPAVGDEIELTSKTRMGLYLPGLDDTTYKPLGRRPLPPGIPVQYDDLHFSRYHYQRVAVEGIVRSQLPLDPDRTLMRLAMGSRTIDIRIEQPPHAGPNLVDHRVRITGLAAGLINTSRRQLVQPYVRVLGWDAIEVIAPAPPATAAPLVTADELLAFRISGLGEQRVRIEGVVAAAFADGQVFLEQDELAFAVRFNRPAALAPGDRIVVAGFPSMERFSASVVDAELLSKTPGNPPSPHFVASLAEFYGVRDGQTSGKHDAQLVQVEATARDMFQSENGITLIVHDGKHVAQVRLAEGSAAPPSGARVRLTGICQVETAVFGPGFRSDPGLVSIRLLSPAGLEVLLLPPWWTARRLSLGLAALGGVVLLGGLWIASLRRQVRRQTAALRHRIEAEAALEERQRIAREFHDTLEQELAGVSLRLDALATRITDDKGRSLVVGSRHLVSRIQTETRDLISDLRDPAETAGDLAAALATVAARHSADGDAAVRVETAGTIPVLPAATVHDLRMIAREAVNNARRHGRATVVTIAAAAADGRLTLRIADNGGGFDPAAVPDNRRGHFGRAGMRERARKLGADVVWQSAPGRGTTVEVTLPLPAPVTRVA